MSMPNGVLILYNVPGAAALYAAGSWSESDAGVMDQVEAVASALGVRGIVCRSVGVTTLVDVLRSVHGAGEHVIFNLVESLAGGAEEACQVPALCLASGKAVTGNDTVCQVVCLDKWQNKAALQAHGVRVPPAWVIPPGGDIPADLLKHPGKVIVKPVSTDASEGIGPSSVIEPGVRGACETAVRAIHADMQQAALVEAYIEGRELNVAILEQDGVPRVLPLAEIDFSAFPPGKPRIVDYAAKWHVNSFEYQNTPRIVPAALPEDIAEEVRRCAVAAWHAVGCKDYARVDIRLDVEGIPYVLEVNPNPDISPDAGYSAALAAAGTSFADFVGTVIANAMERAGKATAVEELHYAAPDAASGGVTVRATEARDRDAILDFTDRSGFFRACELDIAAEVLDDAIADGAATGYTSYTAVEDGTPIGWVCFGPTPCTEGTFDVYWIVVDPQRQGRGVGRRLMALAEEQMRLAGARLVVVETSGMPRYASTRRFYERLGFTTASVVTDFYASGDDKVILTRTFGSRPA